MKVTVYSQPGCRPCKRIMDQLSAFGVPFEVVDISLPEFSDAKTYVAEVLGAKSTPVVVSDVYEPIIGYQPDQIKQLVAALTTNE
ncbi:glutaredoxin domain-containing protein [Mycobacterium intracellulare]|uniref:Glutaredoxin domain-containing protein n=1 Tax=Mycobacterium intracellulare TaxID=1767 RepID=A0AAE4R7D6_MYCIT|nr:glutaredoxin domain-containing protein [Mycobacterium intracellulare]MDV6975293.1 glutaredoxin domain-containing protein [Mycobacterium intracellulare]MDV6980357.1 glutaredoxin domain-containing protein [Mycobacterium intracellulare]MDV7010786.1 glutaredoxin domain-containing protein [Mycobacterium intracellulare]MDV7025692.1 glutaredoxin domain-containing protein [Mycobacterium intracellulare]